MPPPEKTTSVCQKHGKGQHRLTQDEILRNISSEKPGPAAQDFYARNNGPPSRISYAYSKLCVTANQSFYSSSNSGNPFCLLSIAAKNKVLPSGTW